MKSVITLALLILGLPLTYYIGFNNGIDAIPKARVEAKIETSVPLPNILYINGEEWNVLSVNMGSSIAGLTNCSAREIYNNTNDNTPLSRDSMWHEVYHAMMCHKGSQENANWQEHIDTEDHDVIYPLAMSQASFVHDNPEFMKWAEEWK